MLDLTLVDPNFWCVSVERKYEEYVPDRISESEFWSEFIKSHYFHRDRTDVNNKDFFAGCMEEDARSMIIRII